MKRRSLFPDRWKAQHRRHVSACGGSRAVKPRLIMKIQGVITAALLIPLAMLACGGRLAAGLPSLNKEPWFGFFAGHDGSKSRFGIAGDGEMLYNHNNELAAIGSGHPHRILPSVEETLPSGKILVHRLLPETIESSDEATDKPAKMRYRGKVKNGATIEVEVEFERREIRIRGRIADAGGVKNPLRFTLITKAPPYYRLYQEKERLAKANPAEKLKLEKQLQRLEEQASKEEVLLARVNGDRVKQPLLEPATFDASFNGDGFHEIDLDFQWLNGRRITFTAGGGSRMLLRNPGETPVFKHGFSFTCVPDPAKGPAGVAELTIVTR
jgi:hypothetical protein